MSVTVTRKSYKRKKNKNEKGKRKEYQKLVLTYEQRKTDRGGWLRIFHNVKNIKSIEEWRLPWAKETKIEAEIDNKKWNTMGREMSIQFRTAVSNDLRNGS
jgi:hypothetical protein